MQLIDTHAHLDDDRFAGDFGEMLDRAREVGVGIVIAVATTAASSQKCIDLARSHPMVWATVGIHPNHIAQEPSEAWDQVAALATDPHVVALGETGLDRHWDTTPFHQQEEYFRRHLELSGSTGLPVVIHCREAEADMRRELRAEYERRGPLAGVMHSFSGDGDFANECLNMGLYLSFAGMLTYKNAAALRAVAAQVPLDRVLVETDCPYLAPVPQRGKRNEPAFVAHTAACLAEQLCVPIEVLAARTTANARTLFRRKDQP